MDDATQRMQHTAEMKGEQQQAWKGKNEAASGEREEYKGN